jgi:hypothetical protein
METGPRRQVKVRKKWQEEKTPTFRPPVMASYGISSLLGESQEIEALLELTKEAVFNPVKRDER